jgi:hypothetical protein
MMSDAEKQNLKVLCCSQSYSRSEWIEFRRRRQ